MCQAMWYRQRRQSKHIHTSTASRLAGHRWHSFDGLQTPVSWNLDHEESELIVPVNVRTAYGSQIESVLMSIILLRIQVSRYLRKFEVL